MARGADLFRAAPPSWGGDASFLLLNPRWPEALKQRVLCADFPEAAGRVWVATSGTGGLLKMVALSRSALEASARTVNSHLGCGPDDIWINPLPLFHVGGLGIVVRAALSGARSKACSLWSAETFVRQAAEAKATLASLVPTQVHDLAQSSCKPPPSLRAVVVGGGAIAPALLDSMRSRGWNLLPSYGLTEAASQVATAESDATDFASLPLLPHVEARLDGNGVLELRGVSLLDGWMVFPANGQSTWEDPKREGWYRTGDRAELRGRRVRILGRADDLVKIRGELVDMAALERALRVRVPKGQIALQAAPDERAGYELYVVTDSAETASAVRAIIGQIFPPYARPREVIVGIVPRTPLGKTVRGRGV